MARCTYSCTPRSNFGAILVLEGGRKPGGSPHGHGKNMHNSTQTVTLAEDRTGDTMNTMPL